MGVKGNFFKFLTHSAPDAFHKEKITSEKFSSIAIDMPIYLNKYKAVYGANWRPNFEEFLDFFHWRQVRLVCVFDGPSPVEKQMEREHRRKNRIKILDTIRQLERSCANFEATGSIDPILSEYSQKCYPSFLSSEINIEAIKEYLTKIKKYSYKLYPLDYDWAVELIVAKNATAVTALGEAEKYCARLCFTGRVQAALSEDSDLLVYQCPLVLTKFNPNDGTCQVIDTTQLLLFLSMTRAEFVDFCIMCGTDYNRNCPGIGTVRAFQIIQKFKTIEEFAANNRLVDVSVLNHVRVRELFSN